MISYSFDQIQYIVIYSDVKDIRAKNRFLLLHKHFYFTVLDTDRCSSKDHGMITTWHKTFFKAITWNSLNLVLYKSIITLHQIGLFYALPIELYAASGVLFSGLYFIIGFLNLGFDSSLFTFFHIFIQSKQGIRYFIGQTSAKIILLMAIGICLSVWTLHYPSTVFQYSSYTFPITIAPYLISLCISESMRKYVETIAQLLFLNKQIAYIQVFLMLAYSAMIWSCIAVGIDITLFHIFIPLVITSWVEVLVVSRMVYTVIQKEYSSYQQQNRGDIIGMTGESGALSSKIVGSEQVKQYLLQMCKNLFSPNCIFLLIAFSSSVQQSALLRLCSTTMSLLYMLFNKAIAVPTGALFSLFKRSSPFKQANLDELEHTEYKKAFMIITERYIQIIYATLIASYTLVLISLSIHQATCSTIVSMLLFIALGALEYFTITYEKWFIVHQKTSVIMRYNIYSALIGLPLVYLYYQHATYAAYTIIPLLTIIHAIRTIVVYNEIQYVAHTWGMMPSYRVNRTIALSAFIIACLLSFSYLCLQ